MPKQKTHKASKKRFRVTKNGKVLGGKPGRRHLLSVKTGRRRRHMRRKLACPTGDAYRIKILLGEM